MELTTQALKAGQAIATTTVDQYKRIALCLWKSINIDAKHISFLYQVNWNKYRCEHQDGHALRWQIKIYKNTDSIENSVIQHLEDSNRSLWSYDRIAKNIEESLLTSLAFDNTDAALAIEAFENNINDWKNNPRVLSKSLDIIGGLDSELLLFSWLLWQCQKYLRPRIKLSQKTYKKYRWAISSYLPATNVYLLPEGVRGKLGGFLATFVDDHKLYWKDQKPDLSKPDWYVVFGYPEVLRAYSYGIHDSEDILGNYTIQMGTYFKSANVLHLDNEEGLIPCSNLNKIPDDFETKKENVTETSQVVTSAQSTNTLPVYTSKDELIKLTQKDGLWYRSPQEIKIACELDKRQLLFFPNAGCRVMNGKEMKTREPDFLINYKGVWGILECDSSYHASASSDHDRDALFMRHGIITRHYSYQQCLNPKEVVDDFLGILEGFKR